MRSDALDQAGARATAGVGFGVRTERSSELRSTVTAGDAWVGGALRSAAPICDS